MNYFLPCAILFLNLSIIAMEPEEDTPLLSRHQKEEMRARCLNAAIERLNPQAKEKQPADTDTIIDINELESDKNNHRSSIFLPSFPIFDLPAEIGQDITEYLPVGTPEWLYLALHFGCPKSQQKSLAKIVDKHSLITSAKFKEYKAKLAKTCRTNKNHGKAIYRDLQGELRERSKLYTDYIDAIDNNNIEKSHQLIQAQIFNLRQNLPNLGDISILKKAEVFDDSSQYTSVFGCSFLHPKCPCAFLDVTFDAPFVQYIEQLNDPAQIKNAFIIFKKMNLFLKKAAKKSNKQLGNACLINCSSITAPLAIILTDMISKASNKEMAMIQLYSSILSYCWFVFVMCRAVCTPKGFFYHNSMALNVEAQLYRREIARCRKILQEKLPAGLSA